MAWMSIGCPARSFSDCVLMNLSFSIMPVLLFQFQRLNLLFQCLDALRQIVEVPQVHGIFAPLFSLAEREDGRVGTGFANRFPDQRVSGDLDVIGQLQMPQDPRAAADQAIAPDHRTAGDPGTDRK